MAITVNVIRQAEINANQAVPAEDQNSLKYLLSYLTTHSDDEYVLQVANIHLNSIERKEREIREKKERIIANIQKLIEDYTEIGDSVTVLSVQAFADECQKRETNTYYVTAKNRLATRPKIETALKNLVDKGILNESIEKVSGYRNYVKVWTRINM